MKNKWFNIISTVLLLVFIVVFVSKSRSIKAEFVAIETNMQKVKSENALLKNNFLENCKLPVVQFPYISLFDANGNKINLDSLLASSPNKLVLRLSQEQCSSCKDKEVRNMERMQSGINQNQIIILAMFPSSFAHMMFVRENRLSCPVYNIDPKSIVSYFDTFSTPYYFVLNSERKAYWFYRPIMGLEDLTDSYLARVISIINTKI